MWETRRRRFGSWYVRFFCLCMCGNDQGFVHFLHIDAKSPPAFPKYKWTNIRRGEQKILNKYNKFG